MKKNGLILLVLLFTMALIVSGCGSANSGNRSREEQETAAQTQETVAEAENTEKSDKSEEPDESARWREYTDSAEKKDTALDYMRLGLSMPLEWDNLLPFVNECEVKGRKTPEDIEATIIAATDLSTSEMFPYGTWHPITVDGCSLDVEFALTDEELKTCSTTIGDCITRGRYVLRSEEDYMQRFFGIPKEAKPEDLENPNEQYWLLEAIVDKYGKPDYIGDFNFGPALYWERDGYYFGFMLFIVPLAHMMELINANYIPAEAWEWFNTVDLVNNGWEPLVPYTID